MNSKLINLFHTKFINFLNSPEAKYPYKNLVFKTEKEMKSYFGLNSDLASFHITKEYYGKDLNVFCIEAILNVVNKYFEKYANEMQNNIKPRYDLLLKKPIDEFYFSVIMNVYHHENRHSYQDEYLRKTGGFDLIKFVHDQEKLLPYRERPSEIDAYLYGEAYLNDFTSYCKIIGKLSVHWIYMDLVQKFNSIKY